MHGRFNSELESDKMNFKTLDVLGRMELRTPKVI